MDESYMGQFLVIDLSLKKSRVCKVPEWLKEEYIGGKGFGARLLFDLLEKGTDALSPENPLMFLTGPLTSTAAPSMRACVVCKSPLTGGYLDSFFGGSLGPEIKFAGYDGVIIRGRAEKPLYLWIHEGGVEFCDAASIWGKDALESNELIKKEICDPSARVATIGQAGENRVLFSLISCEYNRQAGRGGAGAVMGSKNLKGIAFKGTRLVRVNDPAKFQRAVDKANLQIAGNPDCQALTESGTSFAVPWSSEVGLLPNRNFKYQDDPKADKIGDVGQSKHIFLGKAACFGCPIRCSQMGAVRTGKYAHIITDTIEYETAAMLGANLGIHDVRALASLAKSCDKYGADTISMGNVLGFAFEAVEKGLLESPGDISLEFGSVSAARSLIKAICLRENPLGVMLGQGVKRAAREMNNGAEEFAMHVKGMEIPGWAPRGTPGMGLAYMTSDRGACHQRGFMVAYEAGGEPYKGKPVDSYGVKQKAEILKGEQDYLAGTDTLVKCDFAAFGIEANTYAELLQGATGRKIAPEHFNSIGERIWNLTRCFNIREGLSFRDERLPKRLTDEPLTRGLHKGQRISGEDTKRLLGDYYRERGWTEKGIPTEETLKRLKIGQKPRLDRKDFSV